MGIIDEKSKKEILETFQKELEGDVNLVVFYDDKERCQYCAETVEMLDTLSSLDGRIKVTKYDIKASGKEAKFMGVENTPAIVIGGSKMYKAIYYGIPAGYEFSSLIGDILDASKGSTQLSEATKSKIKGIKKLTDIKVFVTPTCPYCPQAVRMAHQLAMETPMIKSTMVEAMEFQEMSSRYGVMGVPKIVINDTASFEGALPEDAFVAQVLSAAESAHEA